MPDAKRDLLRRLARTLVDQGKLIEAGWVAYKLAVLPATASETQIDETRKAFFAGALHLFQTINTFLDDDAEPTEADLERMSQIHAELQEYFDSLSQPEEDSN